MTEHTETLVLTIGKEYRFKRTLSKGRPFVGRLTRKLGALVEFELKSGEKVRVQSKYVKSEYEFRPYMTKTIRAEAHSETLGETLANHFAEMAA